MARIPSIMVELGTVAPSFRLNDVVAGRQRSLKELAGHHGLLVMFICRKCPFVQHIHAELANIGRDYQGHALGIAAMSSNDADTFPDDGPASLREQAQDQGFTFPICTTPNRGRQGVPDGMYSRRLPLESWATLNVWSKAEPDRRGPEVGFGEFTWTCCRLLAEVAGRSQNGATGNLKVVLVDGLTRQPPRGGRQFSAGPSRRASFSISRLP
jgi:hypothetical protein